MHECCVDPYNLYGVIADLFKGSDPKLTRTADPPLDRRLMPRLAHAYLCRTLGGVGLCGRQGSGLLQRSQELLDVPPLRIRHPWAVPSHWFLSPTTRPPNAWLPLPQKLQALDLLLTNGSVPLTLPMDSTEKLIEKLVERRMQNTGESQAVATANVMAAFQKLKKDKTP